MGPIRQSQEAIRRCYDRFFDEPVWCGCSDPCRDVREHKERFDEYESKLADEAWEAEKEARNGI